MTAPGSSTTPPRPAPPNLLESLPAPPPKLVIPSINICSLLLPVRLSFPVVAFVVASLGTVKPAGAPAFFALFSSDFFVKVSVPLSS